MVWISKKLSELPLVLCVVFFGVLGWVVFSSANISEGVHEGLLLCGELVIPSLFVFLCFCEWGCQGEFFLAVSLRLKPLFCLLMGKFFHGGSALLLCLLGGYPMGATGLAALTKQNKITSLQCKRLALWIFCPSPAFVITGIGQGMFHSSAIGFLLWGACVLSCLLCGRFLCWIPCSLKESQQTHNEAIVSNDSQSFVRAVAKATEKMLMISGIVVFVAGILEGLSALPFPGLVKSGFYLFLEVTNGCGYLADIGGSLPLIGAVLMFGGIGTHWQCKLLLGDCFPSYITYFGVRILQSLVCYGLVALFCYFFPQVVPTISVGVIPTANAISVLPTLGLLGTCFVFLCSLQPSFINRRECCEKSRIYS